MLKREFRKQARYILKSIGLICVALYFCVHLITGPHGLMSWSRLEQERAQTQQGLKVLQQKRDRLSHKVILIRQEVCPDLLEELAKKEIGYLPEGEVAVLD